MITLMLVIACLSSGGAVDDQDMAGSSEARTYRIVAAFQDKEALESFRRAELNEVEIGAVNPGFKKIDTIVEVRVSSKLPQAEVLKRIRASEGVQAAVLVRKHRASLAVQFDSPVDRTEAVKRLEGLDVLAVRLPGKVRKSKYFEVVVETDQDLEKLISEVSEMAGVDLAELNLEYRAD